MKTFKEITNLTKNFLEGPWGVVATCMCAMIFWLAGLEMVAVCVLALPVIVCFLICDNVRLLYGPFLLVPFFSVDVQSKSEIVGYAIIFAVVFVSFVYFMIKHRKTKVRKGDLFWGLLIADIAFLLGGVVGHFSIRNFAIILALNIALYLLYFVAINHTKDFIPYLMLCFVVVGCCIAVQHSVLLLRTGNVFQGILSRSVYEIGDVSINVVALYYPLGVIGGIYLFKKAQKYNYLFLVLAILQFIFMLLTYCRGVIMTSGLVILVLCIILIAKSPNRKKLFLIYGSALAVAIALVFAIPTTRNLVLGFISRGFKTSGRDELWAWCIEQFKSSPVFGVGFVADEIPPSLTLDIVMAHNTILQWFTSLGIVGTVLMIPFYYEKYKTFSGKYNFNKLCTLCLVLCIALEGILNPACTIMFFIVAISVVIVGATENENRLLKVQTSENNSNENNGTNNTNNDKINLQENTPKAILNSVQVQTTTEKSVQKTNVTTKK